MRANFGDVFLTDFDSLQQARLYAQSMCLASSQYQLDRALNNRTPAKATELLGVLEHDYQVIPNQHATLQQRRDYLTAVQKVSRGNRREAMEDALRTLLGTSFIALGNTLRADIVATPSLFPSVPGVFLPAGAQKKVFALTSAVVPPLSPTVLTVPIASLGGTAMPLIGETYCVDPDSRSGNIEQITITGVGVGTISAIFLRAHAAATLAARPHPYWISNQRVATIVVTQTAAQDPETRRKINELMARASRAVSTWQIVQGSTAGFFTCDDAVLGLPDINVLQ